MTYEIERGKAGAVVGFAEYVTDNCNIHRSPHSTASAVFYVYIISYLAGIINPAMHDFFIESDRFCIHNA